MLLDNIPYKSSYFGYYFHFGFPLPEKESLNDFDTFCKENLFSEYSTGFLELKDGNIKKAIRYSPDRKVQDSSSTPEPRLLLPFFKNVRRRMKLQFRQIRNTYVIELSRMPLKSIKIGEESINSPNIYLCGLIMIQRFGVASIILWIEGLYPNGEKQWIDSRSPQKINIELLNPINGERDWLLTMLVRYFVLISHLQIIQKGKPSKINTETLESDNNLNKYLEKSIPNYSNNIHGSEFEIDDYPFYFIEYDLSNEDFENKFNDDESIKDLRLGLYGDEHWKLKSIKANADLVENANTSTRDSIKWLVHNAGTLKMCSNAFGTTMEESLTATFLETDLILTMKFFLKRANSLATTFIDRQNLTLNHDEIDLAKEKYQIFQDFDNFCQLEVSNKETTRRRIEKCKKIFEIDSIYRSVTDRFDLISSLYNVVQNRDTHNIAKLQTKLNNHQIVLALVFGFFGCFDAAYGVFSDYLPCQVVPALICSFSVSVLATLIIYFWLKRV